jgi:hypothetical protein
MQQVRLLLLVALAAYFFFQFRTPSVPASSSAKTPASPETPPCTSRILEATASTRELRLKVSGTAETLRVSYDGGMIVKATEEVCSGGECRVFTPAAPKTLQLDGCPAISLP